MSSSPIDLRQQRDRRLRDKLGRELGTDVLAALADPTVVEVVLNTDAVPVYRVSRWLGHATSKVTEEIYAHWIQRPGEHGAVDELDGRPTQNDTRTSQSDFRLADEDS